MDILAQLAAVRAQKAQLAALETKEQDLLMAYAAQHRQYPAGQPCVWRGRLAVVADAYAYYADEAHSVAIVYGINAPNGEPLDVANEANIAHLMALPAVPGKVFAVCRGGSGYVDASE